MVRLERKPGPAPRVRGVANTAEATAKQKHRSRQQALLRSLGFAASSEGSLHGF